MRILFFITTLLFIIPNMFGQKEYRLISPDGKLDYLRADGRRAYIGSPLSLISTSG